MVVCMSVFQDFRLDASYIYNHVGRYFGRGRHYSSIHQLLGCIKDSGLSSDQAFDEVIGTCVRVMADQPSEVRQQFVMSLNWGQILVPGTWMHNGIPVLTASFSAAHHILHFCDVLEISICFCRAKNLKH